MQFPEQQAPSKKSKVIDGQGAGVSQQALWQVQQTVAILKPGLQAVQRQTDWSTAQLSMLGWGWKPHNHFCIFPVKAGLLAVLSFTTNSRDSKIQKEISGAKRKQGSFPSAQMFSS